MKISESIINNLLIEIDSVTYRLRNIKQSFKSSKNNRLKERLFYEYKNLSSRVEEIYNLADFINNLFDENISFSALLREKSKRTLKETKTESNLFLY